MSVRLRIALVAAALAAVLAGPAARAAEAPPPSPAGAAEKVIVHLGDSITITSYLPGEERIDAVLGKLLAGAFPKERFRNVNLGLDGDWVEQFLRDRYEQVLRKEVARADVFIIRYGTNDQQKGKSPEEFTKDLQTLIERLRRDYPGCKVILGTGPHIAKLPWCNEHQYGPNWQAIRELGKKASIPVVDVYALFERAHSDGKTVLGKNDNPKDIHPNAEGVRLTAAEMLKAVALALFGVEPKASGGGRGEALPGPERPSGASGPGEAAQMALTQAARGCLIASGGIRHIRRRADA
jgi:lysophospholipase L1-like esterase